jgi:hypothetical protein
MVSEAAQTPADAGANRYPMRAFLLTPFIATPLFLWVEMLPYTIYQLGKTGQSWGGAFETLVDLLLIKPFGFATWVAVVYALVVYPLFLILRRHDRSYRSAFSFTILAGTIIAMLPYAISIIGPSYDGLYADGCTQIENGVRTACGWYYLRINLFVSLLFGAFSGLVFAMIYTGQSPKNVGFMLFRRSG